jgi:DnaJ-class molecular chaperone
MPSICLSCGGGGKVIRVIGFDADHYPLFAEQRCPACGGTGFVDATELFVVPRGLVKDDFFVSPLYTEAEQKRLRAVLEEERKWFDRLK